MRLLLTCLFAAAVGVHAASPLLTVRNEQIPSPAGVGSAAPQLATSGKNEAWMIWTEPAADSGTGLVAVRAAAFNAAIRRWSPPVTLAATADIEPNPFSTPQIAADSDGHLAALWFAANPAEETQPHATTHAMVSQSRDGGATWSAPERLTTESPVQEFASIAALGRGRFVAVWLDGRGKPGDRHAQALCGRELGGPGPDVVIDDRVCDCCGTSIVAFPDGSARAVYRDRSDEEVREISTVRFAHGRWSEPAPLSRGNWKLKGCPVNGPAVAAHGPKTAAAWYTAEEKTPRVYAALSATAGEPFLMPARIDDGQPMGQVGIVTLNDGSALATWIEVPPGNGESQLLLRRIHADLSLSVPIRVAPLPGSRRAGVPRIVLVDQASDASARVLVAHTEVNGDVTHVVTRLIHVDPPAPPRAPCADCPPDITRGSPVHGYVLSIDTEKRLARVKHDDIPGVMPAMTMRFHVAAEDIDALKPSAEIYARIERRDDGWWLFAARTVPAK